ncbi:MAG TPA: DoxX family protein [Sediminibacterium sp.]|nr:DoxX family protein [Sediminibacterium sp.]
MKITESTRLQDFGLLVLRLSIGGLLILHGLAKLFHGHEFIRGMLAEKGLPQFLWLGVPITEVLAPLLLILGVFSRMAGASIAVLMVLTIVLAHLPNAFTITETGGLEIELNLLYLFGALTICFTGPGGLALYRPTRIWLQ